MNRFVFKAAAAAAILGATLALPAQAQLSSYSQDFEGLDMSDPLALTDDGWLIFGNVFDSGGVFLFGYGPFGAPNGGPAFSAIVSGEGGAPQGLQQLSIYSDYNCCSPFNGHFNGTDLVESNVFQEQTIGAADVGTTWNFSFEAKAGTIDDSANSTTALAFIKTLDPNAGFATTNFITVDTTDVPVDWAFYKISITIDASLEGQILQFGYSSTSSNFEDSGVFYDNVSFVSVGTSEFTLKGAVTLPTGAFVKLTPPGTPILGPLVVKTAAVDAGSAGATDITSIDVNVGGFCFSTQDPSVCPLGGADVPITSIDAAALTFAGGAPTGGTLSVTAFSPTFMVGIPIDFDLTAGTFFADGGALGTVSGNTELALPPFTDTDGDGVLDNFDNCIDVANPGQEDANGDAIGNLCDADVTGPGPADDDCFVNFPDLQAFKDGFFGVDPELNLDGLGNVNFADLTIVKGQFFGPPGPSAAGCN